MTQLQLALDGDLRSALDMLSAVHPFVDIIEVGTPLVFRAGMAAVRRIRELYPQLTLVADLKIMDAGRAEADIAFCAGADIVTVMALAADATIAGVLESAWAHNKRAMVDMMQVADTRSRACNWWSWAAICSVCTPRTISRRRSVRPSRSWRICGKRCLRLPWQSPGASSCRLCRRSFR